MEYTERLTADSLTIDGVTIEVDVELSVNLHRVPNDLSRHAWRALSGRDPGRSGPRREQLRGTARLEPVQIRIGTTDTTLTVGL